MCLAFRLLIRQSFRRSVAVWRGNKSPLIGLLLVLILGIIGGALIYVSTTVNRATATDATNSSIAQANARNIAQLVPALVASNPDPYSPTNGKLTLYDPMHDNSNQGFGWQEDNGCAFTGSAYQVNSSCTANNLQLNNFAFEIEVDFTQASSQGADGFFRNVNSRIHGMLSQSTIMERTILKQVLQLF